MSVLEEVRMYHHHELTVTLTRKVVWNPGPHLQESGLAPFVDFSLAGFQLRG